MTTTVAPRRRSSTLIARVAILAAVAASVVAVPATASAARHHTTTSGAALVARSFAVSKSARSVRITGTLKEVGSGQSINIDSTVLHNGSGYGTVNVQGQTIKIVQVGPTNYFKAGKAFWAQVFGSANAIGVPLYASHWVKSAGVKTPAAGFSDFVSMSALLGGFDFTAATWVRAGTTSFGGKRVYVVHGTQNGMTGTILIAASGPPYLAAIERPAGQGALIFTAWNRAVRVNPPKNPINYGTPTG